jgi:DNA polymerase-3 subunit epsilon
VKYFYCDLETTGLDHKLNGVWQLAYQIWVDGAEMERGKFEMQPVKGKLVSNEALETCGITMEHLRGLEPPAKFYHKLKQTLGRHVDKFDKKDKAWFVGYNANFDAQFVRRWFEDHGDKYFGSWFWYPILDVAVLGGFVLAGERGQLENFKLGTLCTHLGIEFDEDAAHDAQYDIDMTRQAFEALHARGLAPLGIGNAGQ